MDIPDGAFDWKTNGYTPVFNDEFKTPTLDRSKWQTIEGGEIVTQRKSYMNFNTNGRIEDGSVVFKATRDAGKVVNGTAYDFFSAAIQSVKKFSGVLYFEARMALPTKSRWMSSIFKLVPTISTEYNSWLKRMEVTITSSPQDDGSFITCEYICGGTTRGSFITGTFKKQIIGVDSFHTYAFSIEEDRIKFIYDGEVVLEKIIAGETINGQIMVGAKPFDAVEWQPHVGLEFRGPWIAGLAEMLPQEMKVDYVRVFVQGAEEEEKVGNTIRGKKMRLIQG